MCNTLKLGENLSALMAEHNLKAPAFAKILNVDRSTITEYQRNKRTPTFSVFISMIEYFNISADVLLGLIDYSPATTFSVPAPFGNRLRTVMEETKTSQYRIEKDLHISGSTMYNWLTNKSLPNVESLIKLSKYMDVSIDYLLGRIS